jgi:hypothetical protein
LLATSFRPQKDSEKVVVGSATRLLPYSDADTGPLRSRIACVPREDDEADDQEKDNRHPILHLEAKNIE